MRGGHHVEIGGLLDLSLERFRERRGLDLGALVPELVGQLLLHLIERSHRTSFLLDQFDDVKAVLGFHEIAGLSGLHREGRCVELRHHASPAEEIEIAADLGVGFIL